MVYIFGWVAIFVSLAMQMLAKSRGNLLPFFLLGYFAAVAFVRGNVGTDTYSYELMFASFVQDYAWDGREPGFVALAWILATLLPTVELAVRAIALAFFGLLAVFLARSDANERFLLLAYLLPAFAYQYSMNGLRAGFAAVILLLVVQEVRRRGIERALRVGLVTILFHYSSAFSLLYFSFSQRPWLRLSSTVGMLVLLVAVAGAFLAAEFYMMDKLTQYRAYQAPNALSGLSKIAAIALLVAGALFGRLPRAEKAKLIVLGVGFALIGWVITQFTYAGLRILDLLSFVLPLSILASYSRVRLEFERPLKLFIAGAGILSAYAIYRGFLLEEGLGNSPFLPYEVYEFDLL